MIATNLHHILLYKIEESCLKGSFLNNTLRSVYLETTSRKAKSMTATANTPYMIYCRVMAILFLVFILIAITFLYRSVFC